MCSMKAKVEYLKGFSKGLQLSDKGEDMSALLLAIIDCLDSMAEQIDENTEQIEDLDASIEDIEDEIATYDDILSDLLDADDDLFDDDDIPVWLDDDDEEEDDEDDDENDDDDDEDDDDDDDDEDEDDTRVEIHADADIAGRFLDLFNRLIDLSVPDAAKKNDADANGDTNE